MLCIAILCIPASFLGIFTRREMQCIREYLLGTNAPWLLHSPTLMSSILLNLQSRARVQYSGARCYNENGQLILCPVSRIQLIIIGVVVGLFLLVSLFVYFLTRCSCNCRRRRNNVSVPYPADPEFQGSGPYMKLQQPWTPSTERLMEPPEKIHLANHPHHY
ncbi:hypothetical protein B0H11DRAFT_604930 [Mycena galericulata]|nr:hypothetical protein B0H11DRAFT_604930 [Mycena galericulata]